MRKLNGRPQKFAICKNTKLNDREQYLVKRYVVWNTIIIIMFSDLTLYPGQDGCPLHVPAWRGARDDLQPVLGGLYVHTDVWRPETSGRRR